MDQATLDRLVHDECYTFLPQPFVVTSGESISPIRFDGEKIIGPNASAYKLHALNPIAMAHWAREQLIHSQQFQDVMHRMADSIDPSTVDYVSGGRTGDWPVAAALGTLLDKPMLFVYKPGDGSRPIVMEPSVNSDSGKVYAPRSLRGASVIGTVDLVTTASSTTGTGGLMDQVEELGGKINHVYAIIDRNQGAERILAGRGAELHAQVQINEDWLQTHDPKNRDVVMAYLQNPSGWSVDYLEEHGLDCIAPHFDPSTPQAQKDNRIVKLFTHNQVGLSRGLVEQMRKAGFLDSFRAVRDDQYGVEAGDDFQSTVQKYNGKK